MNDFCTFPYHVESEIKIATNGCVFAAINQRTGSLRKQIKCVQQGQKGTWILIHFVVFVGFRFLWCIDCQRKNV